jgi:site-specific recombinase XerD
MDLLNAPCTTTLRGKRDRALLGVLLGSGLRREEAASLTFEHIQQRDGQWVIVDLVGKRNSIRSIHMASWTKAAIDQCSEAAGIKSGNIYRLIRRDDRIVFLTILSGSESVGYLAASNMIG